MSQYLFILVGFFVLTNCIAFLMMWIDKGRAGKRGAPRISEGMMFFMATVFGSVGVYAGMYLFRHKTKKWYFIIGMPFIILQNIVFLLMIYFLVSGNIYL